MPPIDLIAFDADDTLWHNESLYEKSTQVFLKSFRNRPPEEVRAELDATESRNIPLYGYGIKSFMLSMMETAARLSDAPDLPARMNLVATLGKGMLTARTRILPYVRQVLDRLDESYALMMITKGDLLDQEHKLKNSGLKDFFKYVKVVTEKTPEMYSALTEEFNIAPKNFLMVGNSVRSDVLPVITIGGQAVHIPYELCWVHERLEMDAAHKKLYHEIVSIRQLPQTIKLIEKA